MRVLVVEDEVLIRMLICDLLEQAGYRCVEAGDAETALPLLEGPDTRPDILVTDYNLGPGMNGKVFAQEAMRRLPGLPVAYVTGNPDCFEDRPLQAWERLVRKPFGSDDLLQAMQALGIRPAPGRETASLDTLPAGLGQGTLPLAPGGLLTAGRDV